MAATDVLPFATPLVTSAQDPESPSAPFRWTKHPSVPNTWARRLWGSEMFYHQWAKVSDHAADMTQVLMVSQSLPPEDFVEAARKAWLRCRFLMPLVAARVEDGALDQCSPHLGCFVYTSTDAKSELDKWLDLVVKVHKIEEGQVDQYAHVVAKSIITQPVEDETLTTLHLVVRDAPESDGRWLNGVILHAAHFLADGAAGMRALKVFLQGLAKAGEAEDEALPWGQEVLNLPPALPDIFGLDPQAQDAEAAMKLLGNFRSGQKRLGLMPQQDPSERTVGKTKVQEAHLEPEISAHLAAALKEKGGYTISQAVDAARHASVWFLRQKALKEDGVPIQEDTMTSILNPVDVTRQFPEPWSDKPFYSSGTSGFTTTVPLEALPDFEEVKNVNLKDGKAQEALVAGFEQTLPVLAAQWRDVDVKGSLAGANLLMKWLRVDSERPTHLHSQHPAESFTSLGKIESALPLEYGSPDSAIVIEKFDIMSRITEPRLTLHSWSLRNCITLHVSYADCYSDAYVTEYLDLLVYLLKSVIDQ